MEIKIEEMGSWERKKACYLLEVAEKLGMDTEGYGEVAVNQTSGYTYLWIEDYNFTLYMPINCELQKSDVWALVSNPQDGEEEEITIDDMSLEEIEEWADQQFQTWKDGE